MNPRKAAIAQNAPKIAQPTDQPSCLWRYM